VEQVIFDMQTIHQVWHKMRVSLAGWQIEGEVYKQNDKSVEDGMECLHGVAVAREKYFDTAIDKHQACLDCQHKDMSENYQRIVELQEANHLLREEVEEQKVLIESMSDRLCNCRLVPIDRKMIETYK
jgi:hypothetical protein